MKEDEERRRLSHIYTIWSRDHERRADRVWRDESPLLGASSIALLVAVAAGPILGVLDSALWNEASTTAARATRFLLSGVAVVAALLAASVLQAGLVDRFLARQTADDLAVRSWIRRSRLLLAAVPLFGLYTVPGWRWLLERRPGWAFRVEPVGGGWALVMPTRGTLWAAWRRRLEGASRRLASVWVVVSLYLLEMLVLVLAALWLGAESFAGRRTAAWTVSGAFHVSASLGMAWHFAARARRAKLSGVRTFGLCLLALVWLPPIPWLPLLGFLPYIFIDLEERERTLVHQAYGNRTAAARLPGWSGLKERLRAEWKSLPWWRRIGGPPPGLVKDPIDLGQVDARATDFYRLRSLSLPLETAWLVWMSLRLASGRPGVVHTIRAVLGPAAACAVVLGLAGLLLTAALFFRRLLRATSGSSPLDRHSCARAFAFTQLGFAAGLLIGEALYTRDAVQVAAVAAGCGLLGMLVLSGPLLLNLLRPVPELFKPDARQQVAWLLLCGLLLGASLRFGRAGAGDLERDWRLLQTLILVAPLLGMFPGVRHLDWLLRPFHGKKMFSRELPVRVRATLAFLVLTGLLPLGGLAIPAWIAIRRRGSLATRR